MVCGKMNERQSMNLIPLRLVIKLMFLIIGRVQLITNKIYGLVMCF